MARVFSQKHFSICVGNGGIYSVSTDSVYQKWQFSKQNVSRESRGNLAGRPYPWNIRKNQLSPSCPDSSHFSHVQGTCITSQDAYSRATCDNISVFNLPWVFKHTLSHRQPLQIKPTWNTGYKRLNIITIKFGTEFKANKNIVGNYNFTGGIWVRLKLERP